MLSSVARVMGACFIVFAAHPSCCAPYDQHGIPEYNALTDKHCAQHNFLDLAPLKQLKKAGLVRVRVACVCGVRLCGHAM